MNTLEQHLNELREKVGFMAEQMNGIPCTMVQSKKAHDKLMEIMDQVTTGEKTVADYINAHELHADAKKVMFSAQIDRYMDTLAADLVHVQTRYVLTDAALLKPAGFAAADLVFVKNNIFIQTDILPKTSNLKCFDMTKCKKSA